MSEQAKAPTPRKPRKGRPLELVKDTEGAALRARGDDALPRGTADEGEARHGDELAVPRWRGHDRTHLELGVEYRPSADARREHFEWEAYFFVPESFRLDSRSYDKDDFWADFRSYLRLAAPDAELSALTGEPLERLKAGLSSGEDDLASRELRLFACRVRRAGIQARARVFDASKRDVERACRLANAMARDFEAALEAFRETTGRFASGAHDRLEAVVRWVDEDVSLVVETLLAEIARTLERAGAPARAYEDVVVRALAEARHRAARGYDAVIGAGEPDRLVEKIEFRRHTLKRFTSSVLWLSAEVYAPGRWAQHVLYAIAASVAMAFAVVAALYNSPNGPHSEDGRVAIWLLIAVVAYAVKDRMKAALQEVFSGILSQHFPDRRWRLCDKERRVVIGHVDEQSGFASFDELPEPVLAARRLTRRHAIEEDARPETVLWHRKSIVVEAAKMREAGERFDALVEIFRLDLSRWLAHTDDHKARTVFANPATSRIETIVGPRVYNIGVVYRLRRKGEDAPWHRVRAVVSRKGIRRVEPIC